MQNLNEIFARIAEQKKERKRVKAIVDEALKQSKPWNDANDEVKACRDKRRQIEDAILADYPKEMETIEQLTESINADQELLSDAALSLLLKGEQVKLETDDGELEPRIKVTFRQQSLF